MRWTPDQLAALTAVIERGTFDAAARSLQITPSAVSQRVRALESAVGQVLVRRTTPCAPTIAGRVMLRLARQVDQLSTAAHNKLTGPSGDVQVLPVVVNADSLATWFDTALSDVAGWPDAVLRLRIEDQAHSAELLRGGEVIAAITSETIPIAGCRMHRLGALRYLPAATPEFIDRYRGEGDVLRWQDAPMVNFNLKDTLQYDHLARHGVREPKAVHQVPSSHDFATAVRLGLGWGMVPEPQLAPLVRSGALAVIVAEPVDVDLAWQHWTLDTPLLARLTETVLRCARGSLRQG